MRHWLATIWSFLPSRALVIVDEALKVQELKAHATLTSFDGDHAFVVDDEPQFRSFVSKALKELGYISHEFSKLPEVEAALTDLLPKVIILDLSLGGSDAVEMIRSLSSARFGGNVLLVSGHDEATIEDVSKIGERRGLAMIPPLRKPFRLAEFKARLTAVGKPAAAPGMDSSLELALRNNWLELWYQPKVDLKTMSVYGAEGLIRCRHPEHGIMLPPAFLPPPRHPLYEPLTDFVVRRSLSDWLAFAATPAVGRTWTTKRLAINVPASILQTENFVNNLRRHLPSDPEFPGIIVEITEEEAISDPDLAREIATQLRLYKIQVSIDDFGAGHSSLARLDELPFAELKLDRRFVDGCSVDEKKRETCEAVAKLARRFKMTTVAEGVETSDDLQTLIDIGFDVGQGYLFAKPMQREDFVNNI